MCCNPIVVFSDRKMTLRCGECGKEFLQDLPVNGNHRMIDQLLSEFGEHTRSVHDCGFRLSPLIGSD